MILDIELQRDKAGNITAKESEYQPSDEAKDVTAMVLQHFTLGNEIMNSSFAEFNNKSVVERMNIDQRAFNSYQPEPSDDPDFVWQSNAIRPITRNKVISVAAHLTGSITIPQVFAQNDRDEEDKDAAMVMRDLLEWTCEQSDYEKTFLYAIISALVNPATIIHDEYAEIKRKIKEIKGKDGWTEKEVIDEVFSGFKNSLVPIDELYINDIYEADIQKQAYLIWRRAIDFTVAEAKYGKKENFKYVTPGIQILFSEETGMFYEQYDESLQERLVEEVIYYNRSLDLQLVFINGVLVTTADQPNPRKDKMYPFVKFGFEPVDEGRFFYYKSLVNKLSPDQSVIDTLYRMVIDGTYLSVMPPISIFGDEELNSSITIPGSVNVFNAGTTMQALNTGSNLQAGFNTLNKVESSMSESSVDVLQQGQAAQGQQTAYEIARLEASARTILGLFGKMIGFFVKDFGELRLTDILQFMAVSDMDKITTAESGERIRRFVLPEKNVHGNMMSESIEFDFEMDEMSESERMMLSQQLLDKEEATGKRVIKVNPTLFREMKFRVKVSAASLVPPSDNVQRAMNLEVFDRAIALPFANQEALYKDLLLNSYPKTQEDPDRYIREEEQLPAMVGAQTPAGTPEPQAPPQVSTTV